ncbi:hypothetical protein WA158_004321 [Blastocystis sp. Blastoise]
MENRSLKFCPNWYIHIPYFTLLEYSNNLLFPYESSRDLSRQFGFRCKRCPYTEPSEPACVYNFQFKKTVEEKKVFTGITSDPTLPKARDAICPHCGEKGAVYFQAHGNEKEAMALIFVCLHCQKSWKNKTQ